MYKEKCHLAMHCPIKEAKGGSKRGAGGFKGNKAKGFNGKCNHCGKHTGRQTVGSCLNTQQKAQQVTLQAMNR